MIEVGQGAIRTGSTWIGSLPRPSLGAGGAAPGAAAREGRPIGKWPPWWDI